MTFYISNDIAILYKKSNKNINYMLDYFLSVVDPKRCKEYFGTLKAFDCGDEKVEIALSDSNIKCIKSLFGDVTNELVERLVWVSVLMQEV